MHTTQEVLDWLLQGDVSIVYQVQRDLLGIDEAELTSLQTRIESDGWGNQLLRARRPDGHWGRGFYVPKWTCTHYTLLELKALSVPPTNHKCRETVTMILQTSLGSDGGVNYTRTVKDSDVCINGMVLDVACYFGIEERLLHAIIDYLLQAALPGGGWNCQHLAGARHFSVHTTLSVLEGLSSYATSGYTHRLDEVQAAAAVGEELLLSHRLYQSHRTGQPMHPKLTVLSYPARWRYDILRALDYFRAAGRSHDPRLNAALNILLAKRRKNGTWPLQARHPGQVHFQMEQPGKPSRWNTLRALRVLSHFNVSTTDMSDVGTG